MKITNVEKALINDEETTCVIFQPESVVDKGKIAVLTELASKSLDYLKNCLKNAERDTWTKGNIL